MTFSFPKLIVAGLLAVVTPLCAIAQVCPQGTIALTSPINNASVVSPVTFGWTAPAGLSEYRIWLVGQGGVPVLIGRTTMTSASLSVPSGNNVQWFVEGVRPNCPSIVSDRRRFTVPAAADCGTKPATTLVSPAGATLTDKAVQFQWTAMAGAKAYRLWVARSGQPFDDLGFTMNTTLTRELLPGTYAWYIDTFYENCPAVASARNAFTVAQTTPRCPAGAPTLITPADAATGVTSPVTLNWTSVADAIGYRVYASLDGGSTFTLIGSTTETSIQRPVPPGPVTWVVETIFKGCPSTRSAPARFTVAQSSSCATAAPQLLSPPGSAVEEDREVEFAWTGVSGAVRYIVWASAREGAASPIGETTATQLTRHMPFGPIEWWVVAFFQGCRPVESAHFRFTIPANASCGEQTPIPLTPLDESEDTTSPAQFSWSGVPKARRYRVWAARGNDEFSLLGTTESTSLTSDVPPGLIRWFVQAVFDGCPPLPSPVAQFRVVPAPTDCRPPRRPTANVIGQALSGTTYSLRWSALVSTNLFEVQESTSLDFANATTLTVNGVTTSFTHTVADTPVQYLYRVRGVSSCSDERGPYSDIVGVFVVPQRRTAAQNNGSAEAGTQSNIVQTLFLPGSATPVAFTASVDKPWLTVTPASGTVPTTGLTLTVTADPSVLQLGTNTATVVVSYGTSGKVGSQQTTSAATPVSVSLVTPVAPAGKNTPPPDSLIIPAVAHAVGANESLFESDVRITNLSSQTMKYQLNFTPSGVDGTLTGSSSTIQVEPGATLALDDILASFFGTGTTTASIGTLEIRPTTTTTTTGFVSANPTTVKTTVASSRTYNFTPNGTFGQYIPAISFSRFIAKSSTSLRNVISLQQIAHSATILTGYRTNVGVIEGAGEAAEVLISVFNAAGDKLGEIPLSLKAGEHRQFALGIPVDNGRLEAEVLSSTGQITAYASVVDNLTNDPLLVFPVPTATLATATRYVLPGIADLNNPTASWRSDTRIYNAGSAPVTATLSYYPQPGNTGAAAPAQMTIAPGEVRAIDNTLQTLFNLTNSGGSLVVTTPSSSSLIVTARTYNQTSVGTYGQFIPAVTSVESIGLGNEPLQILQLEHSTRFRSNIGIAETTGNDVTAEVSVTVPDSKVTAKVPITLAANGFIQISLANFNLGNVYNARVSVKVISGSGKVTAYGSVIDNVTQDPTYVPAQ